MRTWWWLTLGVALVVAGGVAILVAAPTEDYGWFAYAPLDGADPVRSDWVVLSRTEATGAVTATVGLLVLVAGVAYRRGRQSAST